jgi:hypothetical protein
MSKCYLWQADEDDFVPAIDCHEDCASWKGVWNGILHILLYLFSPHSWENI